MNKNSSAADGSTTESRPNEVQTSSASSVPDAPPTKGKHPRKRAPRPPRSEGAQTTTFSVRSELRQSFGQPVLSHHELTGLLVHHYGSTLLRREDAEKALMQSRELLEACVREGWLRPHTSENRMTCYSAADIAACLLRIETHGRPGAKPAAAQVKSKVVSPAPIVTDSPSEPPPAH